jgi:Flp pilus assembly protein TadD
MNKSLTPLIIFLSLIVLLTIIVINFQTDSSSRKSTAPENPPDHFNSIELHKLEKKGPAPILPPLENTRSAGENIQPPNIERMLKDAIISYDKGNDVEAEDKIRTILIFDPSNYTALSLLGNILYKAAKYPEAEVVFRKQGSLKPEDPVIYNNLGSALAKQKRYDEAVTVSLKALELEPESPVTLINLAGIYSVSGEVSKALEYFRRAYDKIGEKIIPISFDRTLDNIRYEREFLEIIKDAEAKASEKKSGIPERIEPAPLNLGNELPDLKNERN